MNEATLALEKNAADQEMMNQLFRSAHTIKGSSRMLAGADRRAGPQARGCARGAEERKRGRGFFDVVFRALDMISAMVEQVKAGGESMLDASGLLDELQRAAKGRRSTPRRTSRMRRPRRRCGA